MLSQAELKSVLRYEPSTGIFTWLKSHNFKIKVGSVAGRTTGTGYITIQLYGKRYVATHLAWLYVYGVMPTNFIDHIKGDKRDNRIGNLREVTRSQNAMNRPKQADNTSGHKGVYLDKKTIGGKQYTYWRVKISKEGVHKTVGGFSTPEEAHAAYVVLAKQLHEEFYHE